MQKIIFLSCIHGNTLKGSQLYYLLFSLPFSAGQHIKERIWSYGSKFFSQGGGSFLKGQSPAGEQLEKHISCFPLKNGGKDDIVAVRLKRFWKWFQNDSVKILVNANDSDM